MGESWIMKGEPLKDTAELIPMLNCCAFAQLVMINARKLILRNLLERLPINSQLSLELCNKSKEIFGIIQNSLQEKVNFCYPPKIEGGDRYNVELTTIKDRRKFGFDTFKFIISLICRGYRCHFVRTISLHSTQEYANNYKFMKLVYEYVLNNLKDGIELCKVYENVQILAKKENQDLAKHLEKEFGFELGPNFRNKSVSINADSKVIVKKGMFFAITINLVGLKDRELEYSICYSNTVVVRKDQPPDVLTCYKGARMTIINQTR